jgi:hypothetical protein
MDDHDLLVRIDERVKKLDICMSNHLKHHWIVFVTMVGALSTGIITLILAFIGK